MILKLFALALCCKSIVGDENFLQRIDSFRGNMFPHNITVAAGENVVLRLLRTVPDHSQCLYRAPGKNDTDIHEKINRRIRTEDFDCGLTIEDIQLEDAGFWRLTSVRGDEMTRGVAMLNVITVPTEFEPGEFENFEDVTPEGTNYCYVIRSGEDQSKAFPLFERCVLPDTPCPRGIGTCSTESGAWNIIAGVTGQMKEITFAVNIESKDEKVISHVESNSKEVILTCNLQHSKKWIKFCRFLRLEDSFGLNVIEGIGSGRYSYYGKGFRNGECGLEILYPEAVDKTVWKCFVGYGGEEGDDAETVTGLIADASEVKVGLSIIEAPDVATINGTALELKCYSKIAIDYCWFKSPSGVMYPVSDRDFMSDDQGFWYKGNGFPMGECGIVIGIATEAFSGKWSCHVGKTQMLEASADLNVRITETLLLSSSQTYKVIIRNTIEVECKTFARNTALEYCRFVTPEGIAFSINENVTSNNAILGKYFSNPNHNLKSGYCSLIIKGAETIDSGNWICAGKLNGTTREQFDEFKLIVVGGGVSVASTVGMIVGAIVLMTVIFSIGYFQYKKRRHSLDQAAGTNERTEIDREMVARVSINSSSSSESELNPSRLAQSS